MQGHLAVVPPLVLNHMGLTATGKQTDVGWTPVGAVIPGGSCPTSTPTPLGHLQPSPTIQGHNKLPLPQQIAHTMHDHYNVAGHSRQKKLLGFDDPLDLCTHVTSGKGDSH